MLKGKEKLLFAIVIVLAATAGYFIGRLTAPEPEVSSAESVRDCTDMRETRGGGYTFINPLLECDNYQASQLNSVVTMEREIKNYIQMVEAENKASFVSVYFRDLNFGPWMGINEKENFSPASLLKVPIMIAAFKKAEGEPAFLQKKVAYNEHLDKNTIPNIVDVNLIKIGKSYTVEDLIKRMIEHSDNEAKELLLHNLDQNFIVKVMQEIGINTSDGMGADFVSVKDYSSFFRLLYNATYLNRNLSEKALQILSKTSFDKGLVAGLPKDVTISHKFGERAFSDSDIKQLHECGIVYLSGSPYLLCVMTRGTDFEQLAGVLSNISGIVYKDLQTAK
jgi:beta-lactamase class A